MKKTDYTKIIGSKYFLLVLIVLFSSLRFYHLGYDAMRPWDEALYALRSIYAVNYDQWISQDVGLWNGSYPPLYVWLTAITFKIIGITEFAARFWSALFGVLTCAIVFYLGEKLFNRYVGFIAGIILALNPSFLLYSQRGQLDVPVNFFIALTILLYVTYHNSKHSKFIWLSGISFGLALMTKTFVGVFALAALAGLVLYNQFKDLKITNLTYLPSELTFRRSPLKDISNIFQMCLRNIYKSEITNLTKVFLIGIAIALPWNLYMLHKYGMPFIDNAYLYHGLKWAGQPIEGHVGGDLYHINNLIRNLYPYLFLFIFGVINSLNKKKEGDVLMLCWLSFILGFFTVVDTKMGSYVILMWVPVAVITARYFCDIIKTLLSSENLDALSFFAIFITLTWIFTRFTPIKELLSMVNLSVLVEAAVIVFILLIISETTLKKSGGAYAKKMIVLVILLLVFVPSFTTTFLVPYVISDPPPWGSDWITANHIANNNSNNFIVVGSGEGPTYRYYIHSWTNKKQISENSDLATIKSYLSQNNTYLLVFKKDVNSSAIKYLMSNHMTKCEGTQFLIFSWERPTGTLGASISPDTLYVAITNIIPDKTSYTPDENMTVEITLKNLDKIKHNASAWWFLDPPGGESPWKEPVIASKHLQMYLDPAEERTISITSKVPNKEGTYDLSAWVHVRIDGEGKHSDGAWHINTITILPGET